MPTAQVPEQQCPSGLVAVSQRRNPELSCQLELPSHLTSILQNCIKLSYKKLIIPIIKHGLINALAACTKKEHASCGPIPAVHAGRSAAWAGAQCSVTVGHWGQAGDTLQKLFLPLNIRTSMPCVFFTGLGCLFLSACLVELMWTSHRLCKLPLLHFLCLIWSLIQIHKCHCGSCVLFLRVGFIANHNRDR